MYIGFAVIALTWLLFSRIPLVKRSIHVRNGYLVKKCSIIIPARNEENTIGRLLSSIQSQFIQPSEVIVVNDGSSDRTKQIAETYGVTVLDNPPLPHGWNGKSWACWNGARQANGEWLMFVDSDTWFERAGLLRIAETYKRNQCQGVLSIHPYHKMQTGSESLSMIFHLVVFASTNITHLFGRWMKPSGGFGQCFLCSRAVYEKIGGHEAVKGEMVEHFSLSQHAKTLGEMTDAVSGKDAISMRMYSHGLGELFRGWSKSFASGAKSTNIFLLFVVSIWISFLTSFLFQSIGMISTNPSLYMMQYALIVLTLYFQLRKIGDFTIFDSLIFPVHLLFFIVTFSYSFLNTFILKSTQWKDRYVFLDRGKDERMK
ncbi:glycosyl transferase [Bacillus sp. KH172YL63]|nr:glycosyl transferase [Bacillus sp. KH172YL63]